MSRFQAPPVTTKENPYLVPLPQQPIFGNRLGGFQQISGNSQVTEQQTRLRPQEQPKVVYEKKEVVEKAPNGGQSSITTKQV